MLDPKIPFLENALDPPQAQTQLQAVVPNLRRVSAATLVRHKAGRRALIEYHLDTATGSTTLLGKIRAKGTDRASYQVQQDLWRAGWDAHSRDRLSVPEPMGLVPNWHMMLQRKIPGTSATQLLPTNEGIPLTQRIAELAHKLHRTPVPTAKTHTLADELQILGDRLPLVAEQYPRWATRISDILTACRTLAASPRHPLISSSPRLTTIHRDFYADQILVDGDRLWLVDLDLCCQGSPAVDIGNFIAHITEQSLREMGDAEALSDREMTLQATYLGLTCQPTQTSEAATRGAYSLRHPSNGNRLGTSIPAGIALQPEIELYTVLTLVRHIHISTRIPSRRPYTEAILKLCETRLGQRLNWA